jgi:enediyne biosynthesis protein E4
MGESNGSLAPSRHSLYHENSMVSTKSRNISAVIAGIALLAAMATPEILRLMNAPPATSPKSTAEILRAVKCLADEPADVGTTPEGRFFVDITDDLGIDFQPVAGPLGTYFLPEINGTGAAFFDFDSDGDLDLFLAGGGRSPKASGEFPASEQPGNRLYRREPDGRYTDVTQQSGLAETGYTVGCAAADFDNDGDVDLFLTQYGRDSLLTNDGNGRFEDISIAAGIMDREYGTSAAFFDYDRDGWLDLLVVNYVDDHLYGHTVGCGFPDHRVSYCGPLKFSPSIDRLYHNEGLQSDDQGRPHVRFRDVTKESGLEMGHTNGFAVVCADFNGDRWPDVFVANDELPNRLWINQKDGSFRDEGVFRGAAMSGEGRPQAGMGATMGDLDGDGDFDLVSTHLVSEYTTIYRNGGDGIFTDASREMGLVEPTRRHTGWGVAAVDLDHDANLDLVIVNGLVVPCRLNFPPHGEEVFQIRNDKIDDSQAFWRDYADRNLVLVNSGGGAFVDHSNFGGDFISQVGTGRALAVGDIDDDGDQDLLVTYCGQRVRIFRNDVPKRGHWLKVSVQEPALRRLAYGAEVTVVAGGKKFRGTVSPSTGYLSSNDPRVHFGLGMPDRYTEIVIQWADGVREFFTGGLADRNIFLRRGEGTIVPEGNQ